MTDPKITRRHFAGLCAALGTTPLTGLATASGQPAFLSAYRDSEGVFGVAALDDAGSILFRETLPARGHDTVISPDRRTAVTFARRPGRFALAFDLQRQRPTRAFEAVPGRHFYGHGFFSTDGQLLFATENDFDGERGVLGVYDVALGFRRIGEFETHGIGPHEALRLRDGQTFVIANGGILTHPDWPRQKLNLPTMTPSLIYLDARTGERLEQVSLPSELHQLSIRHLAETGDGRVWFAGQYEGAATDTVPLVGRHRRGEPLEIVNLLDHHLRSFRQYVGSIRANVDGSQIAVTSPRGGISLTVDATTLSPLHVVHLPDVCGVAAGRVGFVRTTGQGVVDSASSTNTSVAWDNHLRGVV